MNNNVHCGFKTDFDKRRNRLILSSKNALRWRLEKDGSFYKFTVDSCGEQAELCGKYMCNKGDLMTLCEAEHKDVTSFQKIDNGYASVFKEKSRPRYLGYIGADLWLHGVQHPWRMWYEPEEDYVPTLHCPAGSLVDKFENLHLQLVSTFDASGSYTTFKNNWASQYEQLIQELEPHFAKIDMGLTTFVDKPRPKTSDARLGVYGYKLDRRLSSDVSSFGDLLRDLAHITNYDYPENSLDALGWTVRDSSMEWIQADRDNEGNTLVRVIALSTDNKYKTEYPSITKALPACDLTKEQTPDETAFCSEQQVLELLADQAYYVHIMLDGGRDAEKQWGDFEKMARDKGLSVRVHKQKKDGNFMANTLLNEIRDSLCEELPKRLSTTTTTTTSTTTPTTTAVTVPARCRPENLVLPSGCFLQNVDFDTNDIRGEHVTSKEECARACCRAESEGCVVFTFNQTSNFCWLKSSDSGRRNYRGAVSARMSCVNPSQS